VLPLRTLGENINSQYLAVETGVVTEGEDRDGAITECIKTLGNNTVNIPVMYGATHVDPAAMDMNNGSPNFHFTTIGALSISVPSNVVLDETQEGFIITQTKDITWNSAYKVSYSPTKVPATFSYLWFHYVLIDEVTVVVSLVDVIV